MLGIVVAMEREAQPFLRDSYTSEVIFGRDFYRINIGGEEAVLAICGVGKVNASYTTALLITHFNPDLIVNCGVSGAIKEGLKPLDLVAITSCVQHDADTSPLGDERGFVSTVNMKYFPTDKALADAVAEKCNTFKGIAASGEQFVADGEKKKEISSLFDASVCDMESGAVAQCAYISGKKYACVRCVSDSADGSAPMDFVKFCDVASEKLYRAVEVIAEKYSEDTVR